MERIRTRFRLFFMIFAIIFVVSVFGGLGVGFFNFNPRSQGIARQTGYRSLVPGVIVVAEIGDKKIYHSEFFDRYLEIESLLSQQGATFETDPFKNLERMNLVLDQIFREQTLLKYAKENGVNVTDTEINQELDNILSRILGTSSSEKKPEKSIISEVASAVKKRTERQKALRDYLERTNQTMPQLIDSIKRSLLVSKANEHIRKLEEEKGDKVAKEKLEKIKAELKAGKEFAEVAKKYSEDEGTKDKGGLVDYMLPRSFFDPQVADVAFKLKVGEYSEPIKQEFGYEIVQVVEKKEAVGKEFEREKPKIIEKLKERNKNVKDYKPSDEEIKREYEQLKYRHIVVRNPYQVEAYKRIGWLIETQKKVIHDPQILAYRAYAKLPLYFPELKDTTVEQIASQAKGQVDVNPDVFNKLLKKYEKDYWDNIFKTYGEPPKELIPALKEAGVPVKSETETDTEKEKQIDEGKGKEESEPKKEVVAEGKSESSDEDIDSVPAYPLAIGLLLEASKTNQGVANIYYYSARLYSEWIGDSSARKVFPLDLDVVRGEIENLLKMAIGKYEFQAHYYAILGKNYAEWVKPEEARKNLELALKYGGKDEKVLETVHSAYLEINDEEKAREVAKTLGEVRAARIESGQSRNIPIQIPSG